FFFFFQAEDGIRDRNVTGVQTCALPICRWTAIAPTSCRASRRPARNARWSPGRPPGRGSVWAMTRTAPRRSRSWWGWSAGTRWAARAAPAAPIGTSWGRPSRRPAARSMPRAAAPRPAARTRQRLGDDEDVAQTLAIVVALVCGDEVGSAGRTRSADRDELVVRFAQTCGPVHAKGLEDTAFYRYTRFVAVNEVGAD